VRGQLDESAVKFAAFLLWTSKRSRVVGAACTLVWDVAYSSERSSAHLVSVKCLTALGFRFLISLLR
jgi:hypothetical protein